MVWLAKPVMAPLAIAFSTGLSTGARVVSLTTRNTALIGDPTASFSCQPVSVCAIGLISVIRPAASVAITASPMLFSVTDRNSALAAA